MKILFFVAFSKLVLCDDVLDLIKVAGYQGEAHEVATADGYLLKVHRVRPYVKEKSMKNPVFLMHGLLGSSSNFVVTGRDIGLAYLLADNGHDVWMGNARGNRHSTLSLKYSTESKEFWDFSWHEIGFFDLPAMIDYMLQITGASETFYVGHSQGTTALMVLLSTQPEYNDKIIQGHLMTPAVFMKNFPNPLTRFLTSESDLLDEYSFLSISPILRAAKKYRKTFCSERAETKIFCPGLVLLTFLIFGANKNEVQLETVRKLKNKS